MKLPKSQPFTVVLEAKKAKKPKGRKKKVPVPRGGLLSPKRCSFAIFHGAPKSTKSKVRFLISGNKGSVTSKYSSSSDQPEREALAEDPKAGSLRGVECHF